MELFKFTLRNNNVVTEEFFYTNNKDNVSYEYYDNEIGSNVSIDYISRYIEREEISLKVDSDLLKINVDMSLEPFSRINNFILNRRLEIEVRDLEKGIKFVGYRINYEIDVIKGTFTVYFNNLSNMLEVKCPTRTYGSSCPFKLYSKECSVNKENFKFHLDFSPFSTPSDFDKIDTTRKRIYTNYLSTRDIGKYTNGILEINNGEQQILILKNREDENGHYLDLFFPVVLDLSKIKTTYIYQGCSKTMDDCENKFNNILNFGGFPFIPSTNYTQGF